MTEERVPHSTEERDRIIKRVMSLKCKRNRVGKYQGDKSSKVCPVCGRNTFGYWSGRFKSCLSCNFDNEYDRILDHIRFYVKNGRPQEASDNLLRAAEIYLMLFKEWEPKDGEM